MHICRILEDLDSLAGSVALSHLDGSSYRTCGGRTGEDDDGGEGGEEKKEEGEEKKAREQLFRRPHALVTASVARSRPFP